MTKKIFYLISGMLFILPCFANDLFDAPEQFWSSEVSSSILDKTNKLKEFEQYDFSGIWISHQKDMLGYIGEKYQRFFIHFTKIQKDKKIPNQYLVTGKTKVQNNINDFVGKISLQQVYGMEKLARENAEKEYINALKVNSDDVLGRFKKNRYFVVAKYEFRENPEQKGSGEFSGIVKSFFYLEKDKVFYDDLDLHWSDNYANNLFAGSWKSYKNSLIKKCNFGNFRIPDSGDLDIGAGYFSPDSKYSDKGWKSYVKAYGEYPQSKLALMEEEKIWW